MRHKLNLERKFLLIVISAVVCAITALTLLVVRRETVLMQEQHEKNARVVTAAIRKAIIDNMLMGHAEETQRLIAALRDIGEVTPLSVLRPDGRRAFGMPVSGVSVSPTMLKRLTRGEEQTLSMKGSQFFVTPLMNEARCKPCHSANDAIRGIIVVGMSTVDIRTNMGDLIRRMSGFALFTSLLLSGILAVSSRKMLLSPLKGLTDATNQIARGKFVLYRPRASRCHEILDCDKTECPSYGDSEIPCWLQTGTLCTGEPTGRFALEKGNCLECRVYKERSGDEITQLNDNFNLMSTTLKTHEEDRALHVREIEGLNQELLQSNAKLATLLEASRLTTSTLDLDQTLSSALRMILDITRLKVGMILLLEEDLSRRCHDFFDCKAQTCPAYGADISCWRLAGTLGLGKGSSCPGNPTPVKSRGQNCIGTGTLPASDHERKFSACSSCPFFAKVALIPKMVVGFPAGAIGERLKIESCTLHRAFLDGRTIVHYSQENPFNIPIDAATEIVMPLKVKDQITGVMYLASDAAQEYSPEEISFFQFLSEVISAGIFNSRLFTDVGTSYLQTVMALSNAIEAKDPYTRGHSERVADLCVKTAEALGLSEREKEHLRLAAILHDAGKIGIGLNLLRKDGGLAGPEQEQMKLHPEQGVRILEPIHFLRPVLPAIRHHHERFDGSGYPLRLKGAEIPFKARIICVADAWDAMRSRRPYREPLSKDAAIEELQRNAGTQFDAEVVAAFINIVSPSS
jgi:HD-GYP domain-containing protein (c-di-GMP phosphodiesterase class II)